MSTHTFVGSSATQAARAIFPIAAQFPIVCFILALFSDVAYWQTAILMWAEFSAWLLLAGIVSGVIAALLGAIEVFARKRVRAVRPVWPYVVGSALILVIAFFNNLVHAGDGWTSVAPWGLTLSALTVVVILATAVVGASLVYDNTEGARS